MCRKKERKEELVNGKKGESRERVCVCVCVYGEQPTDASTQAHTHRHQQRDPLLLFSVLSRRSEQ